MLSMLLHTFSKLGAITRNDAVAFTVGLNNQDYQKWRNIWDESQIRFNDFFNQIDKERIMNYWK